uniref:Adhesion G-protein coupled receptor G4 n=1 Tax=Otolemur garnettii TaxID=30611 RepID=H0XLE2_OTOGA
MKEHVIYQRLYGLILMSSFIFLSDMLSLKGKRLDFYERVDTYVNVNNTIPELSRFTACIDLTFIDDNSSYWTAFSYITNNTLPERENIHLGLAGDHQQLIVYNLGKTFYIPYHLTPFQWHTVCLIWDGVKGTLEIFLNKQRILVVMDRPQNLTSNGMLALGNSLKNRDSQDKNVPSFPGSLYYFQLWDHILESEEFMKCLDGNVVSWEEDVWLVNKIIPTVDRRLRCFVSENVTIQETNTTLSPQIDITTTARITGLKPQSTANSSTVLPKSMPIFATDYTTLSCSNTTSPPLETATAPENFKTFVAETATFAADVLSTSASVALPIQSTSTDITTNSMKITNSPSLESTRTTKMTEGKATDSFHPTTGTKFLSTFGFTKNPIASKTSAIESQSAIKMTTSLFSTIMSTSMCTTSWPTHKSTDFGALPMSTAGQEFLTSTAAETVPWSTVEETSSTTAHIGTASVFPPEPVLTSTAAPEDSVFPRNQTASTLATTDMETTHTVHSVTLPTRPMETTSALRTAETELTSTKFQDVFSLGVEDSLSTSLPKDTSSMSLSFITSFPFTKTQSVQTVIDSETTHTALTSGVTHTPIMAETTLSPTITGPVHTQNTPTAGEDMHTLISSRSASKSMVSESVPTSEAGYLFSTNETTWTSRPDQALLTSMNTTTILTFVPNETFTSAFHGSNTQHSSTTTNIITPPEAATESEATTTINVTTASYTAPLPNLTSPWFANFSTVSGSTSVTNLPEFKLTTLLLKTIPMSTVAVNELHTMPGETAISPVDTISTLADMKPNFSTEEHASRTTQIETNSTVTFGDPTVSVSKSTTMQRFNATASTTRTSEISFSTIPTDMTTMSLSDSILLSQPTAAHSSATLMPVTHIFSLPVNVSAMVSKETEGTMSEPSTLAGAFSTSVLTDVSNPSSTTVTTALLPLLDQTASMTSDTMPTHRDSIHTTLEATVISFRMTPTAVPSLTDTPLPSLKTPTPVTAKAETTPPSTSVDRVTPSTHSLACSKSPSNNIPIASSTGVISTLSIPGATQPMSQMEKTSSYALSFPYTFSAGGDVVSMTTRTTETLIVDETMLSHTSAHEFTTSVDGHISQSVTDLVNTSISSQLVTGTSISPSDKDQMTTFLAKTPSTMKVTEMFPLENSFISYSQSTSSLEMTDTGFSETTKIPNHQTHSPSEIPLRTPPDENSASSTTSRNTQTTSTLTLHNTEGIHISEMSTNIGKTELPSKDLTITTFLPPEKESMSDLSVYTPRTVEVRVSSTSVTYPVSYQWDTSFADNTTSKTTRTSNPVNINTMLSHLPSLRTQAEVTSVASSISESTQTFPEFSSLSTVGLYNASFPVISTDRITTPLSVSNVPTTLLRETSMATSIPIHQMSSLPVNITAFTSKNVPEIPTLLITKSSKTTHPDSLKSPSLATSGSMSEMPSMSVNDPSFSSVPVSSDTSTIAGSLLSSITPRPSMTTQIATLDVTPMTYAEPTSKSTMVSSTLTTSEMIEVSLRITPPSSSSPPEPTFSSVKPIPTTIMAGAVTPFMSTTPPYLYSSKNTEAIFSIPKTTFSPFLSTTQHSSQGAETTILGILAGLTSSSPPAISSSRVAAITNTSFRTTVPENMRSPTPSDNIHTSLDIQVSPSLTSFKSTPGPIKTVKATTTYVSSDTEKMTSLSENTSLTSGLTKSAKSVNTPVSYPTWIPSSGTPLSLKSFPYSSHSTETKLSTVKTSAPPKSQMVEFPVLGTRITSSNTQSLFTTSWKTLTAKSSQFPISTTTRGPTPIEMETETLHLVPGPLSTSTPSQTGLVSRDVMALPSVPTTGILPTYGLSGNPSLATSSRAIPTTLTDIQPTFEKTTTSVTPGTTLPSTPSGTISQSVLSKATTSPTLTWFLSNLPSGLPLATVSNAPHVITSSPIEVSKSTFLTSDTTPAHPFTNFTTLPFLTVSTIPTQTTPTPPMGSITTSFPTSLPMPIEITDDSIYISTSPETSFRTSVTTNSKIVSQPPSLSGMSMSPSTTKHTVSIGSMPLCRPTVSSEWSRIPAASTHPPLIFPKPTPDSLNVITTTSKASRVSFPLIFTRITPPSTTTVSLLVSSSFETSWLDTTPSFVSIEASTSLIAAESTVSFYNTEMSFLIFDEEPRILTTRVINEFTKNWLNSAFQDSEFLLANLAIQIKSRDILEEETAMDRAILEQREGQAMTTISHVLYSCICQVIIKANSSLAPSELMSSIKNKIHGNVTHRNFTGDRLTLLVESEHIAVKKLDPGKCDVDETASKYKGTYKWLATNPTDTAQTRCIKNEDGTATRICSISINTGKSQWEKPRYKECKLLQELPNKIVDLANITISDENADDVAEHILHLLNESPPLDTEETKIIISKVSDISQCDEISMNLTQIILQIISAVLEKQNESASDLHEVSNEILRIIEHAGHKTEFSGSAANLMVPGLAVSVLRVDHTFEGMTFSIRSYKEGTDPEIYLSDVPLGKTLASIYLPKSLMKTIPLDNLQTILFSFFGQTSLFKTKNFTKALTTYVVSASISDMSIQNLADPVVITLQHIQGNQNYNQVHCAFWDFENNNGLGGWNSSGCKVKETNINHTICQCDHLTHFGVLMDLSRSAVDAVNEQILVLITYTGCGISSIFLGIAMVTYIAFHKLRKDYPSKILINLCTALLMLNLVFLVNSWLSSFQKVGLCITAAVALHYFLLVSLTWMGLEAVHMYFALVKVFNIYVPNYILKFCLVGWGMPAIVVAIIVSVKKDLYGTMNPTTPFCWIKDDSIFYISVVAYFCLIFLLNFSMFCTVLAQVNSMKSHSQRTWWKMILRDLKGTTSLTFLLGLTWGFAFFAWGPVRIFFLYLFAIFNTLQGLGFLIFVFHCVMKKSVREQWQIHLCCGWLRLDNSSDGSSWCGINIGYKQEGLKKTFEHKLLTPSLKSTATSSTFKSLGSAQGIPSEISFPHDDLNEDPYYFSP